MDAEERERRRATWDERHRTGFHDNEGPNPLLTGTADGLAAGRALELAAGDGTNSIWLATRGWQVTAVDWSAVAVERARAHASAAGVSVEWLQEDLLAWTPPTRAYDLVLIVYLHLPPAERRAVYRRAAEAVASGGRFFVVGHDRTNLTEGLGGPQDAERLFTAAELAAELTEDDPGWVVERADVVHEAAPPERGPIDALLVARRAD